MSRNKIFTKDDLLLLLSILTGLLVGVIITILCLYYKLFVFGVNIDIFIAPIIAGFVETFVSIYLRKKSSGAISAIILFFVTNGIGWIFPSKPLSFNIFTVGGFFLMLQAAFPLLINYLLIGFFLLFSYIMGLFGSFISSQFNRQDKIPVTFTDVENVDKFIIPIFSSKPEIPILEYKGLVIAEDVIEFEEKDRKDRIQYMGSTSENKNLIKLVDYSNSRKYILQSLEENAIKLNANAIIDLEFEYTNYNQQIPPDVVIAAYGTAVVIDEKYLE